MLIRLLATLFFAVAVAVVLVRQPVKRANGWGGVFGGMLLIAAGVARTWGHSDVELSEILLLQLDPRDVREYISNFWLMFGYGLALGAMAALPWLTPSTAGEVGTVLRESVVARNSWRKSLARHLRWLLAMAVILLLWRWIGASYR